MARRIEKAKAIILRKQGKTYSEIKTILGVPKSSLSDWLRNLPLTEKQIKLLRKRIKYKKLLAVEKTIITKHKKRTLRLKQKYSQERKRLLPLSERELYLLGLFLYWGEGTKSTTSAISLNNTDPKVVRFYYYWLTKALKFSKEKIHVAVHLYNDMKIEQSLDYWSNFLHIPRSQFIKPYIKKSLRGGMTQKGFGHGTCGLYINNRDIKERIMAGIEAIGDYYSGKR